MRKIATLAGFLGVFALAQAAAGADFRMDDYRAPTPLSLEGARVVDDTEAAELVQSGLVLPIDVLPAKRNAETGAWLISKPRMTIPGGIWLPNVGYGELSPALDQWFMTRLEELTRKDRDAAIMFYCIVDCWMSWNAAKRAIGWGYGNVIWYPDGTDGWALLGLPLIAATVPDSQVPP